MINWMGKIFTILVLVLLLLTAGVIAAAPISTITPGETVFLGEQGLDITAAMNGDSQIGWWASGASIGESSPTSGNIPVSNPNNFFVSPADFSGKLGPWYHLDASGKANGTAFTVVDPNLDIRVYDATVGVDATANGWITTGDEVSFQITTNLYQIAQRAGVSAVPMRIYVVGPDGASFSSLINKAGVTTPIDAVPLTSSPYSTGPIWDTGRHDTYQYGSYNIWVECNVNSMKDNYPQSGKTYTPGSGLLDQERNPLIGVNTRTTSPTTLATSSPTTAMTTVPTTVQTTVITLVTLPTTPSQPTQTVSPTASAPAQPTAAQTKSPGFESTLAVVAMLLSLAWSARKEQ